MASAQHGVAVVALHRPYGSRGRNGNSGAQPEAKDSAEQTTPGTDGDKIEPFEVSVFIGQPDQQPTPDNKIYKLIREKTGASFKFEFLAGDIDQKLGVMIAGGDYPDMMTANQKLTAPVPLSRSRI